MPGRDCPSFFDVAGSLFCIILCFAMVLVELWIISLTGVRHAPVTVWPLTAALLLVIGWAGLWVVRVLMPAWVGRGGD
jgi:polyferredoxin